VSSSSATILSLPLTKVLPRLDALLMVTKSCKGRTCTDPWSVIHPHGDVKTLREALGKRFDAFYKAGVKDQVVSFDRCELGYIVASEGPQDVAVFETGKKYGEDSGEIAGLVLGEG